MYNYLISLFASILLSNVQIYGQLISTPFSVNEKINSEITKKITLRNKTKIGKIEYKVYYDDSLAHNIIHDLTTKITYIKDTIRILGIEDDKIVPNYAFILDIFNNHFTIEPLSWNGEGLVSYKNSSKDTDWVFSHRIPCKTKNLFLRKKPTYKINEEIEGIIEFTSLDFEITEAIPNRKHRVEFKVYFVANAD